MYRFDIHISERQCGKNKTYEETDGRERVYVIYGVVRTRTTPVRKCKYRLDIHIITQKVLLFPDKVVHDTSRDRRCGALLKVRSTTLNGHIYKERLCTDINTERSLHFGPGLAYRYVRTFQTYVLIPIPKTTSALTFPNRVVPGHIHIMVLTLKEGMWRGVGKGLQCMCVGFQRCHRVSEQCQPMMTIATRRERLQQQNPRKQTLAMSSARTTTNVKNGNPTYSCHLLLTVPFTTA